MKSPSATLKPYEELLPFKRVEFPTNDGTILRGNLYHGDDAKNPAPLVIFCHGIGLVKEQYLENWFRHVVQAGYHVLSYDHRSFGDSDGVPREQFSWMGQAEDFIDAVSFARSLPEVNEDKVFGWGVAHAGGLIAIAAAMDKRIAGIIMFLPCIDGTYDRKIWGEWLWDAVKANRFAQSSETVAFWPLSDAEAAGTGGSVLSGYYVRDWSVNGLRMAEQGENNFTGRMTLSSYWSDYNLRPMDFLDRIAPTPVLWTMATNDVVCGPLEFTKGEYDKMKDPKDVCILEGEHLPQYFDPGFAKSVDALLAFLDRWTS
ncbi:alpha/beta-hydrolase [Polyplosphaeria fusca]|uniref:Alpha/beta-hydrolase n=1 Tax=Polyplosphaeria fusca TaxID=682080 RepID=A0A9P4UUV0_9PLEO|nr:alpha/beta-hydrolase [Polyplosphaeria fusca]